MNQINIGCTSSDDQNVTVCFQTNQSSQDIEFSFTCDIIEAQFKVYLVPAKGLNLGIPCSIEFINGTSKYS